MLNRRRAAIKEIVVRQSRTAGEATSELIHELLIGDRFREDDRSAIEFEAEFGFSLIPRRGGVVTNELVNRLREESQDP